MAIDIPRVLPRIGNIPMPRHTNISERIALEMIEHQNSMSQIEKRGALESYKDAVDSFAEKDFFGDTPFQVSVYEKHKGKLEGYAKSFQEARNDSNKINAIRSDMDLFLKTDPDIRAAQAEKAAITRFRDMTKGNIDKIDPVVFEGALSAMYDPKRVVGIGKPLTDKELNPAAMLFDIEKVTDDYVKAITSTQSIEVPDHDNNRIKTELRKNLPVDAKQKMINFLSSHPGIKHYGTDLINKIADDRIERFNLQNKFPELKGNPENFTSDADKERARSSSGEKTYGAKLQEDMTKGGVSISIKGSASSGEKKWNIAATNGKYVVYDDKNKEVPDGISMLWRNSTDEGKRTLREAGVPEYREHINGVDIGVDNFGEDVPMDFTGHQEKYIEPDKDERVTGNIPEKLKNIKNDTTVKDGILRTNNPGVLKKLGYTLSFDDTKKEYKITDAKGNVYRESKDGSGIFKHEDGQFHIKTQMRLVGNTTTNEGGGFSIGANDEETIKNFISAGESDKRRYYSINPDDNNKVSIGLYQFNTDENQKELLSAAGKEKEWDALDLPRKTPAERTKAIESLFATFTPEQKKAYEDKNDEIVLRDYIRPVLKQVRMDFPAFPKELDPLMADMAVQHTRGMSLKSKELYTKIKPAIAIYEASKKTKEDKIELAKEIIEKRSLHVNKYAAAKDKEGILKNRIPQALKNTLKLIEEGGDGAVGSTNTPIGTQPSAIPKGTGAPSTKPKVDYGAKKKKTKDVRYK